MRPFAKVVAIVLGIIALAHLLRVAFRVPVVVGGVAIPQWMSVAGMLFAGGLAVALWRESSR